MQDLPSISPGRLSAPRLAGMFGVTLSTIHNWVKKRRLPHIRTLGGQLRFDPELVAQYLEERGRRLPAPLLKLLDPKRTPVESKQPPPPLPQPGLIKTRPGPGARRTPEDLLEPAEGWE